MKKTKKSKPKQDPETKKNRDAFSAIVSFVNDLWDVFGNKKKVSPLALYHRLTENLVISDTSSVTKIVDGFKVFFRAHELCILKDELEKIPRDVVIYYGDSKKVYLEIQKFIYKTEDDSETRASLRKHLLNISTILDPTDSKIAELEKREASGGLNVDTSTKEGQFIHNIMEKAKTSMADISTDKPMEAMMTIFKSGVIQDMVQGLQQGVGSGEMSMQKLLGTMQSAIGAIMPEAKQDDAKNSNAENDKKFEDTEGTGGMEIKDQEDN